VLTLLAPPPAPRSRVEMELRADVVPKVRLARARASRCSSGVAAACRRAVRCTHAAIAPCVADG
jgi:hypothetical protein